MVVAGMIHLLALQLVALTMMVISIIHYYRFNEDYDIGLLGCGLMEEMVEGLHSKMD